MSGEGAGWQPSLIVLDIFMPELDGIEVCRRLKRDPLTADIPVLFVTASHDEATALAALSAGGRDFVERPRVAGDLPGASIGAWSARSNFKESSASWR